MNDKPIKSNSVILDPKPMTASEISPPTKNSPAMDAATREATQPVINKTLAIISEKAAPDFRTISALDGLPICERYRWKLENVDKRINRELLKGETLIPYPDCKAIVDEIARRAIPPSNKTAVEQATLLLGSYPKRDVIDADIYVRSITSAFLEFPADLGWKIVDKITRELRFLPSRADVFSMGTKLQSQRILAREIAKAHIAEHERREKAGGLDKKPMTPEQREEHDRMMAKFSRSMAQGDGKANERREGEGHSKPAETSPGREPATD